MRRFGKTIGILGLALLTLGVVFIIGLRTKAPPAVNAMRRFNRSVTNPRQLQTAGEPGAYASVIRHVGRRTGAPYQTPVVATPSNGDFLIALPYGTESDWLRNVIASRSATIVHEGSEYRVGQPEILPTATVADQLPAGEVRSLRLFGVDYVLRLHPVDAAVHTGTGTAREDAA
jgi:deazaflavin-dependent oxidoreductase (nitroreductase family)